MASAAPASAPTADTGPALLEAVGIHTFYGASHILHGVDFRIGPGETVGLSFLSERLSLFETEGGRAIQTALFDGGGARG